MRGVDRMRVLVTKHAVLAVALLLRLFPAVARADGAEPPAATAEDPKIAEARAEFLRGAALAKDARWAEALAVFERSASLRSHAVTTFNVGACERALGRYTRARRAFLQSLDRNRQSGESELADSFVAEARAYLTEIDGLLVRATVRVAPRNAAIAIDGRPLETERPGVQVAGTAAPGRGKPPPTAGFELLLDPGVHVVTVALPGHSDAVVNRTYAPGARPKLELVLDRLPAKLSVTASRPRSVVALDGLDVGVAPLELERPAGRYRVEVKREGFVPYRTQLALEPGDHAELHAPLVPETRPLTTRWWFWTAAGTLLAGAVVGTYFLTRPEPERPPLDGGGLGWTLEVK